MEEPGIQTEKIVTKKQAIPTLNRFRHEIKSYEFDVNLRKLNITLLMASPPVFLVSATYWQQISCQGSIS